MPVTPALATIIQAGKPYYRMTSISFNTSKAALHSRVVNGQGSRKNPVGGRYNYPGVITVYLAETLETCLAEKMFYFHREVLRGLDLLHILSPGIAPPAFARNYVLWEINFKKDVQDICDLTLPNAPANFAVIPSLMRNPSQDYWHLKDRRAYIESLSYLGLRAPSSRSTQGNQGGSIIALFGDQSKNLQSITPYFSAFQLMTQNQVPFTNQATDILDFTAGQVQITGSPSGNNTYVSFASVSFNH